MGLVLFFPACIMVYHSRRRGGDVSYFEVPGTVTAKQDGQTDIEMVGEVCVWLGKVVYKGCLRRLRKDR